MKEQSVRILGGVLSIRRFSNAELAVRTGVNPRTTQAWLRREGRYFSKIKLAGGVRGRPQVIYELTAEGAEHYLSMVEAIPSRDFQMAMRSGSGSGHPRRLTAVALATSYRDILDDPTDVDDDAERGELEVVRERFASATRSARRQFDDLREAGEDVEEADVRQLVHYEGLVRETDLHGSLAEDATRGGIAELVSDATQRLLRDMQVAPETIAAAAHSTDLFVAETSEVVRTLSLLSTIGLLRRLGEINVDIRAVKAVALGIKEETYLSCFTTLAANAKPDAPTEVAMVSVMEGARCLPHLRASRQFGSILKRLIAAGPVGAPVKGAYARYGLDEPGSSRREIAEAVSATTTLHGTRHPKIWLEERYGTYDMFGNAAASLIGDGERMYEAIAGTPVQPVQEDTLIGSFVAIFQHAQAHSERY